MIRATNENGVEWEGLGVTDAPAAPDSLAETGLTVGFINDMILRTLYTFGGMIGLDLARHLCLPFKVIEESLRFLKDEKCLEVAGGDLIGRISYRFNATELGRQRAQEAMKQCAYVGPAPVPLDDYVEQTYRQAVTGLSCTPEGLRACCQHLVVPEELLTMRSALLLSAGRSIFIYGPPGNGKTSIAHAVGDYMNNSGGEIYVPHAFVSRKTALSLCSTRPYTYPRTTRTARASRDNEATIRRLLNAGTVDARWIRIRRPVVVTGGELNLDMLDLRYNAEANFYQAPLHVKANGGIFLIDDFGRQLCSPKELLNRWILPLEDRHDFLTLSSGKKFEVPFEQLTIFSTNLDPKDLVDDAFLRRIRHKVAIQAPSRDVYTRIFNGMVRKLGLNPCPEAIDYLYERYYGNTRSPRASDCRDLLETVQSICRFRKMPVQLTRELMVEASASFICEF